MSAIQVNWSDWMPTGNPHDPGRSPPEMRTTALSVTTGPEKPTSIRLPLAIDPIVFPRDLLVDCREISSANIAMETSTTNASVKHSRRRTSVLSGTAVLSLIVVAVSMTVPQWLRARERNTACDAIEYLANVHAAQESYRAIHGRYADDLKLLNLAIVPPAYFNIGPIRLSTLRQSQRPKPGTDPSTVDVPTESWSITLKRYAVQTLFVPYSITCSQDGFDEISSDSHGPLSSLQPRINR